MVVAKRPRKGKACENRTKESSTGVRTSGETHTPLLASPVCIKKAQEGEQTHI